MSVVNVYELELLEGWSENDPTKRGRFEFPIHVGTGAAASSVVYFEVAPGEHCGRHTHSAEEIAFIVSGEAEAELNGTRARAPAGSLVLIPTMAPHDVYNVGTEPVRVVGFFAAAAVLTNFEDPIAPLNMTEFTIGQAPQEVEATA
jgi:quercetin dioxygenase-like cupin family protein